MRHACHKPRNPGLMSARRFKRDERDDGMQTLLGVPAENGRERGKNGGRGAEARLLRQGIASYRRGAEVRRTHLDNRLSGTRSVGVCLVFPVVLSCLFNLKEQRTRLGGGDLEESEKIGEGGSPWIYKEDLLHPRRHLGVVERSAKTAVIRTPALPDDSGQNAGVQWDSHWAR
ncbi:unnamed protein product [Boreogadus saida]